MKKLITFSFVLICNLTFGQISKNLGDFNKVTSFDKIDVRLIQADENKIILSGNGAGEVELILKNDELKIRMPFSKIMNGDGISATVYFKKIEALEANEGSRISSEVVFGGLNFEIIAKEGSQIEVLLDVDRASSKVSSGAIVNLEGKAKNHDAVINAGGHLEAEKLQTLQSIVAANAGGEAAISATDFVDAKVRAGGLITVYGNPKQVNQKTVLGGKIVIH
jgi:Putative auto-transporter adhesin, head GIN domain